MYGLFYWMPFPDVHKAHTHTNIISLLPQNIIVYVRDNVQSVVLFIAE